MLDDILVNFDEPRAEAAVAVLAEIGRKCQVLLLAHHAHVDVARRLGPGRARVHEIA